MMNLLIGAKVSTTSVHANDNGVKNLVKVTAISMGLITVVGFVILMFAVVSTFIVAHRETDEALKDTRVRHPGDDGVKPLGA